MDFHQHLVSNTKEDSFKVRKLKKLQNKYKYFLTTYLISNAHATHINLSLYLIVYLS